MTKQAFIPTVKEDLNRPYDVTLTEGQISTILYCLEHYLETNGGNSIVLGTGTGFKQTVGNIGSQPVLMLDYTTCELYYEGTKRFETTDTGVEVTGNATVGSFVAATADSNGGQLKSDGNLLLNKNGGEAITIYNNSATKTCTIGADGDLFINASDGTNKAKILNDGTATFTDTTVVGSTQTGQMLHLQVSDFTQQLLLIG